MEFNFRLGFYKQECHYQACLVFNLKPGIQPQCWFSDNSRKLLICKT